MTHMRRSTDIKCRVEPVLRCPACGKMAIDCDPDSFTGTMRCEAKRCRAHWWATVLRAGDVRAQLMADFDGDEAAVKLIMARFDLPTHLTTHIFWQVLLTGNQAHHYHKDREQGGLRRRSLALLRRVLAALPIAS
jgi:hypothetical protein